MGRISMENDVLEMFFNHPGRHWHFIELSKMLNLAQSKLDKWLKRFQEQGIILKIKDKDRMPYYISNHENPSYRYKKRIFALNKLYNSGFLNHLASLKKVKSVIIFGSFSRSDWSEESDIDLFVYGNPEGLDIGKYELELHHDIQLFVSQNKKELKKMGSALLRNIIKGDLIKGDIPGEVIANASI
ncbi:MAG: nucleotidyltransferase domain-containing protein [Nanoarchaeota archaeon]|nr:nucleotidyltransferase domain-containing protein [Nanoarchaeota archaeon]